MTLPERTNSTPKSSACRGKYEYVAVDEDVDEDVAVAVAVAVDVAVAVARGGRLTLSRCLASKLEVKSVGRLLSDLLGTCETIYNRASLPHHRRTVSRPARFLRHPPARAADSLLPSRAPLATLALALFLLAHPDRPCCLGGTPGAWRRELAPIWLWNW